MADRQTDRQNYDSQDRASIAASCGKNMHIFVTICAVLAQGAKIITRGIWVRRTFVHSACNILPGAVKVCRSYWRKSDFEQIHNLLRCNPYAWERTIIICHCLHGEAVNETVLRCVKNVIKFTARSELRKVLFFALSVIFLFVYENLGNRWTDLRQIHREDVFGPSLGRVWRSRSISAACVQFMFVITSLL